MLASATSTESVETVDIMKERGCSDVGGRAALNLAATGGRPEGDLSGIRGSAGVPGKSSSAKWSADGGSSWKLWCIEQFDVTFPISAELRLPSARRCSSDLPETATCFTVAVRAQVAIEARFRSISAMRLLEVDRTSLAGGARAWRRSCNKCSLSSFCTDEASRERASLLNGLSKASATPFINHIRNVAPKEKTKEDKTPFVLIAIMNGTKKASVIKMAPVIST
mmetsp:Transcript_75513/g.219363  ORF Transcript_75513/g.219363 Transcript_75513/m.219363 type:complete len:224 (-) Transcript_75513:820-1491(-)